MTSSPVRENRPMAVAVAAAALWLAACTSAPPATPKAAAAAAIPKPAAAPVGPALPLPPVRNVGETFFGTEVADPYRYMEDTKQPEVAAWMKAQAERASAALASIPGRAGMLAAITKYEEAIPARVTQVTRAPGDLYFFERRGASENQFKLYMRRGLAGSDTLLVDPEALAKSTGKPHAINYYSVSPDARFLAYGISQQGSEAATLNVIDLKTNKPVGEPITRADFGGVDWSSDGKLIFFNRLQELKPGMPPTDKYQKSQVWRLPVGSPAARAQPVFGMGLRGVAMTAAELPFVGLTHDKRWAFGVAINGTQREIGLFIASQAGVLAGQPQWRRLFDASEEITGLAYHNNTLYLKTHKGAPRSQLLALDLARADMKNARVVVPQSERVLTNAAAAADALYLEMRDGNVKRLFKMAYAPNAQPQEVKLPVEGSFELSGDEGGASAADPRLPGVVLDLQSWNRARQIYLVAADGTVSNSGLQPQGPFDAPADVVATEVKVRGADGAMVPMSILHKKDVKLDGTNPTILYGYASYGITEEPFYSVSRLAWLDTGGVFAIANPRGSGVYGQEWYKAGFQQTKPNTWRDFIACAEYLVAQKYTSAARLGIFGGSAGGILVGRAMTERPDLFAAVVPAVGALDMVRAEVTPNGVPNIPEFGTRANEAGFKALLAMSTYHQVKDGTKYPAVMLTHGVNDPRVEVWHSTKTAARLLAAGTSGRPVLLRLDYDAGHGIGNTKAQQLQERADVFSFMLWQMGVPGFQPR
jgi:prolyl oligopeptidase